MNNVIIPSENQTLQGHEYSGGAQRDFLKSENHKRLIYIRRFYVVNGKGLRI
jgi:hypothetical protein